MAYTVSPTQFPEVLLLKPDVIGDTRGFFQESFNRRDFGRLTGQDIEFVQDNHSRSGRGVLRGLHYQPFAPQGKLVRVVAGAVWDVVVDVRAGSATAGRWFGVELTADNHLQLWVPWGFAHGFLVRSEVADVLYKTTTYYDPDAERAIAWSDPTLAIAWPDIGHGPILSARDQRAGPFVGRDV